MAHQAPAVEKKPVAEFKPYVAPEQEMPEFSLKAIVLGSLFYFFSSSR